MIRGDATRRRAPAIRGRPTLRRQPTVLQRPRTRRLARLRRRLAACAGASALCALISTLGAGRALAQEPPAAADQAAGEPRMTLEEAVERALAASPDVVEGAGVVRGAEAAERTAVGAFLPDLSFRSSAALASTERFNPQTNSTISGSSDSYTAGLSASMDVFTGGRRGAELRRARAATEAAEASLVSRRFAVILAAKRAFFDELRAAELIGASRERVRRAEEGLAAARLRLSLGTATVSDSLRSALELTEARRALAEAEHQRRTATFALGRTVGTEGPVSAEPLASLAPRPLALTPQTLVELAVERSPAVVAAEAELRSEEAGVRVARAQYVPTLQLSGGSDWFNRDASLEGGRLSWSVSLGLSYPIFNGFVREESVTRAEEQARTARARLPDARREARAELEQLLAGLDLAERQIALAEEALAVAQEDLRVQRERYGVGAATILDQITSQLNLAQAEVEAVTSRYDYQVARAELEALVGREL